MATLAPAPYRTHTDNGFFRTIATLMGLTIVVGFSMNIVMGFSTFSARPLVHVHGVAFMAWVAIFVTQAWLGAHGPASLHRRLGWIGAGWVVVLIVLGCWINIDVIQRGIAPFFFRPQYFLIANPLGLFCFAVLAWSAIRLRKQSDWHMRLQICTMAAIIGPAFGRLLPMPLLIPHSFDIAVVAGLIFPVAGMVRDIRRDGKVHPAWWWGILAVLSALLLAHLIAYSPVGDAIYAAVTTGHPGANVPGLEFPPPPPGMM